MSQSESRWEGEWQAAGFSERVVAFSIDITLFIALFVVTMKLAFAPELLSTHSKGMPMSLTFIGLFICYHAFFSAEGRQSLGKRLLGIRVVDLEGEPLTLVQSIMRSAAYLLSGTLSLGFFWALLSPTRQTWHDMLVGSVVVGRPKSDLVRRLVLAGSWCAVFAMASVYTWELALAAPYYRTKTLVNAHLGLEEIGRLQRIHKELHGDYTTSIVRLSRISGDPYRFMKNMNGLFDAEKGIRMEVTPRSYTVIAQARDRKHTAMKLVGPGA